MGALHATDEAGLRERRRHGYLERYSSLEVPAPDRLLGSHHDKGRKRGGGESRVGRPSRLLPHAPLECDGGQIPSGAQSHLRSVLGGRRKGVRRRAIEDENPWLA